MDTELLRTFLEVNRTRHFGKAAENLFITQSAVSARIRVLEQALGVPLFTRTRNDIRLTLAGQRLLAHAETILNAWGRARQEIAVEESGRPLSVGGVPSLWDTLLPAWIPAMYREIPDLVVSAEVQHSETLLRRLGEETLDLALVYEGPWDVTLLVEEFAKVRLVLVCTEAAAGSAEAVGGRYVYVDWGTSFAIRHAREFPDMPTPALRVDSGRLALDFLRAHGGAAYLARSMLAAELDAGWLHVVDDAPVVDRSAYAVYPADSPRRELVELAVHCLKKVARAAP